MNFTEDYYLNGIEKGLSNYENYRWLPDLTIPMAKFLKQFLRINSGESLLDFGCARGYVVKALRMLGVAAYGYDISEWAINNCDPDVTEYVTDRSPWELVDNCDYLFCKDVLEHMHIDDLNEILPWLFSKTRKDALFIVPLAFHSHELETRQYHSPDDEKDVTHVQRLTLDEWAKLLQQHTKNYSVFRSTYVPSLKLGALKYPGSVGFLYCIRHTNEDDVTIRYDHMMDKECVKLCDTLNRFSGIKTTSSCCGHNRNRFAVSFQAATIEALGPILEIIDTGPWTVRSYWASGSNNIYFYLEGPVDKDAGDALADGLYGRYVIDQRNLGLM